MLAIISLGVFLSVSAFTPTPSLNSPYPFEINKGVAVEAIVGGIGFHDKGDNSSLTNGLRFCLFRPDPTDALVTIEAEWLSQTIFSGTGRKTPRVKWMGTASVVFYEIYHPWAGRIALGAGGQRRGDDITPQTSFRIGGGYYFTKWLSLFVDYTSRIVYRETKFSYPGEATGSLQFVF